MAFVAIIEASFLLALPLSEYSWIALAVVVVSRPVGADVTAGFVLEESHRKVTTRRLW